uniref:1-aminocyclopropane-1-carboxylate oxidase n=1 Tax=Ananas comosus var. bracteatus TaxID=296719 RepID=A0A6V7QG56_ANACO|nr:unnamed protein product [Ananas comosus var. bracteatus]
MVIPVIDFSKLEGEERAETMAQIANGCEEWGFFQLVNHGIPVELLERVKKVCAECYKLREEGFKESKPVQMMKEIVDREGEGLAVKELDDMDWEDVFTLQDDNQWPSNPPEFKETMMEYRRELKKLAEKMLEIMEENLGLEKDIMKGAFTSGDDYAPFFGTKVSHYPPCPRPDLATGLRAHTDAGGVILLFQDDEVSGLQILKDGRWVDVQPLADAIVINTGDQIEVISNGRYKSVWHRVLATRDGNRRSIASFYNPALEATIGPAANAAAAYPTFAFGDYMDVYVKQKFQPKQPRFDAMAKVPTPYLVIHCITETPKLLKEAPLHLSLTVFSLIMAIPVIDFSKLDGDERTQTLAQIANACEEWGFFQLVNHGIPIELLERVKKVCSECYKLREEEFRRSNPVVQLNKLADQEGEGHSFEKLDNVDWEDVFFLQDDNQWPSNPLSSSKPPNPIPPHDSIIV